MAEPQTNCASQLELLAKELENTAEELGRNPTLENARMLCMDARLLYSAFEDESVTKNEVGQNDRKVALGALDYAKVRLDDFGPQVQKSELAIYIKIQRAMAERIEIVRHSTIESIEEMLNEYESKLMESLIG